MREKSSGLYPPSESVVKTAWHSVFPWSVVSSLGGGHSGEWSTRLWPAREVIGRWSLDVGKRVRWTVGVQAPAARMRWVQGRVVVSLVEVFTISIEESGPEALRERESGLAGWWRWTLRARQESRRKRQRSRGSLERVSLESWIIGELDCKIMLQCSTWGAERGSKMSQGALALAS